MCIGRGLCLVFVCVCVCVCVVGGGWERGSGTVQTEQPPHMLQETASGGSTEAHTGLFNTVQDRYSIK